MEKINLSIMSFTMQGDSLSLKVANRIRVLSSDYDIHNFTIKENGTTSSYVNELKAWTYEQFLQAHAILFIGACGIAVRTIAPFVKNKLSDSPVLVMDEAGQFIIPILSGHMGGANEIAIEIGNFIGAIPVITTATDVNGCLAIDVFARKHDLSIGNKDGIAKISAKVLERKSLTLSIAPEYTSQVDIAIASSHDRNRTENVQPLLTMIPREYIIGIGCKKGKEPSALASFIESQLKLANITWRQVKAIATIDCKKEEKAIVLLARENNLPLYTFDASTLSRQEGTFTASKFVQQKMGVDNVCERAAIAGCQGRGYLIKSKQAENGMTIAIAKKDWRVTLYEE